MDVTYKVTVERLEGPRSDEATVLITPDMLLDGAMAGITPSQVVLHEVVNALTMVDGRADLDKARKGKESK